MSADLFNARDTHFHFNWPRSLSGLERVACASNGDLQRMLSAYFGLPISVERVWVSPTPIPYTLPITQVRRVHLLVTQTQIPLSPSSPSFQTTTSSPSQKPRIACVATSTVKILSPHAARLCIDEQFAIGQVFRSLGKVPDFKLIDVTVISNPPSAAAAGNLDNSNVGLARKTESLRRRYTLRTDEFECEIEEVFPDRMMFTDKVGEWLAGTD